MNTQATAADASTFDAADEITPSADTKGSSAIIGKGLMLPFILITACFALWGAANNMTDLLVPSFQKVLSMSQAQSSLVQMAFYGAYFLMALPAAFLIQKYSYKTGVIIGLFIYAAGAALCYPASIAMSFNFFLLAFYVFAAGCAILETVAAPYILTMGPAATATRRINLAQSFNPVGSICGLFLGKFIILDGLNSADADARAAMSSDALAAIQTQELSNVVSAYLIVGVISFILGAIILFKKFPKAQSAEKLEGLGASFSRLIKNKNWLSAIVAQFFFVGCQIGVWTYTVKYILANNPSITTESAASDYMIVGLVLFIASRFICTALMKVIDPARLLSAIAFIAMLLTCVVIFIGGTVGCYALVAISACMSLMFPTIYGLGLTGVGEDRKLGGSGIIMAIVGGAILVPLQGLLVDASSVNLSYVMPLFSFVIVAIYGLVAHKKEEEAGIA
ncbi:L-fucose:H+ symporter permease [Thalassotalea fonticola]|uniref:L-fucose:H+ symporter permease n=1 Tax=Thalassotalea fonticola TaxID=3065649 RepID=A0ABZ0GJL1_9GAMM|nr:L-fucose:H+ symporter permease [Colwelliaceae bacterium S1-1]